jgi:hypothetical protein
MMGKTEMAIKALQRRGLAAMARILGGESAGNRYETAD